MAVYVMPPDHCTAEAVWFCDNRTVRYEHPFAVDEDAVTAPTGLLIGIGHYVSVGISTALSKFALQAFKPRLQRRVVVSAIVACKDRRQ